MRVSKKSKLERIPDVVDLRILEIIQKYIHKKSKRIGLTELQKKIKLNKSTIWDRLKWLEENLYIERIKEGRNVLLQPTLTGVTTYLFMKGSLHRGMMYKLNKKELVMAPHRSSIAKIFPECISCFAFLNSPVPK